MLTHVYCLLLLVPGASSDGAAVDVRVGVVAFGGHVDTAFDRARQLFHDVNQRNRSLRFRLAAGTHADVLHWLQRGLIDVAVMTPGVYVQTLTDHGESFREGVGELLVNKRLPPATGPWARSRRRDTGYHDLCYSLCIVAEHSQFRDIGHIREAAQEGRVKFLFVHPLSVSGRIVPETALRQLGIQPTREQIAYTFSQSESLRLVARQGANKNLVGFIWDDAIRARPELAKSLRTIRFPQLDQLEVPTNVIVARSDFEHRELLQSLLLAHKDREGLNDLTPPETSSGRLKRLYQWSKSLGLRSYSGNRQAVSLQEIGRTLLHYAQSQPSPPRLALVLSGGGAKCAYQVGAITALEEELAALRNSNPGLGIDIDLVVGTSGGAINAVPVAMGITAGPEGQKDFSGTWRQLDQRDIIRPSLLVRGILGLWFALLQTVCLLALMRLTLPPKYRGWVFSMALIALASFEIVLGYVDWSPWRWLGHQHAWHHVWLVCTFGIRAAAWSLLAVGVVTLIVQSYSARRMTFLAAPAWLVRWIIIAGVIGLPTLLGTVVLFWEETFSSGEGIEQALAEKFPLLINRHLQRQRLAPLAAGSDAGPASYLKEISADIVGRRLFRRDLVLTGSRLKQSRHQQLPGDLYFYVPANAQGAPPSYGEKGVPFARHPTLLMDVVMGSSSIFPVFPPRTIHDFPASGDHVELIDGGFAHGSPVEAAVLWGATHIVLIESSPQVRAESRNFLENSAAAFEYLYQQAQMLDSRSRHRVVVFSLSPEPPHLCILDFADNLITAAIDKGYQEAKGLSGDGQRLRYEPRFRKELGQPIFANVADAGE